MKTPSLPLLALAAALSSTAAAVDAPPSRCDADWMGKAAGAVKVGSTLSKSDKAMMESAVPNAAPLLLVDLDSKDFPCDAPLRHYLAVKVPLGDPTPRTGVAGVATQYKWNDPGLDKAWHTTFAQQVGILSAVGEMYSFVDARGLAVVKTADAVVEAALTMGVAAKTPAAGVDGLKDYTGAAFAKLPVYTVAAAAAAPNAPAAKPAELKAALSALLKDKPSRDGKTSTLALGPAVLAYRKAVIDLADELATRSARRDLLAKAGVGADAKFDFVPGPKVSPFAAFGSVKGKDGSVTLPDAIAEKDENYKNALKYVTDPVIKDGADSSTHDTAALSSLDYGLRNLVATRATAVDAAVAAAKAKIGTATVKATLAAVDRASGQPAPQAGAAPDLAAGVVAKLKQNADFAALDKLFENAAAHPDGKEAAWAKTPDGVAARTIHDTMLANAQGTRVVAGAKALEYTVGAVDAEHPHGQKLSDFVSVPGLKGEVYRNAIEDAVLIAILKGNPINAQLQGVIKAVLGQDPAQPIPSGAPVTQLPVVTPAPPKEKSALDTIAAATAVPAIVKGKQGNFDAYLSHESADATREAQDRERKREDAQRKRNIAMRAESLKCQQELRDAANGGDPAMLPADRELWRGLKQKAIKIDCYGGPDPADPKKQLVGRVEAAGLKAVPADDPSVALSAQQISDQEKARQEAARVVVRKAYVEGIDASIDALRKEYSAEWPKDAATSPSKRVQNAAEESGLGKYYGVHLNFVTAYFAANWEGGNLQSSPDYPNSKTSVDACREALWHDDSFIITYGTTFKDPSVDNVDGECVREKLIESLHRRLNKGFKQ